jgi:hypothetical protein
MTFNAFGNDVKVIKYYGNDKYFLGCYEYKDKLRIVISFVKSVNYNLEVERQTNWLETKFELTEKRSGNIHIDILEKNNVLFHVIEINDIKEFDTIKNVLECIL